MPTNSSGFVWTLLENGEADAVRELAPHDFNWRSLHPVQTITPLQVAALFGITHDSHKFKAYLELVSFLLECGADPAQEAPHSCSHKRHMWKDYDKDGTMVTLPFAGQSAIALVVQCKEQLQAEMHSKGKETADWTREIAHLTDVLNMFIRASKKRASERMSVDMSVVELWERVYGATATHDVTFETGDGSVTAHYHVLAQASPVLSAMLSSAMREGCQKRVEVRDASSKGVAFFLELLYTGSSCSDVDFSDALVALDLAHRWQVSGVANMTTRALAGMLTNESFAAIAESATVKGLSDLSAACTTFASTSTYVQKRLKEGNLPRPVLELLGKPSKASSSQAEKRRRTY